MNKTLKVYLETPAGWFTVAGKMNADDAEKAALKYQKETNKPVALKRCYGNESLMFKVIALGR